jgi:hypothetical protein
MEAWTQQADLTHTHKTNMQARSFKAMKQEREEEESNRPTSANSDAAVNSWEQTLRCPPHLRVI